MTSTHFTIPDGEAAPIPTGAPGVQLYPAPFEAVVALLRQGIDALAADEGFPGWRSRRWSHGPWSSGPAT